MKPENIRVQKRFRYDSDERGHWIYVVQVLDDGEWVDVPIVDENGQPTAYE